MVFILGGNSEIGAHVLIDFGLSVLRTHIKSRHKSDFFFLKKIVYLHTYERFSELPANISILLYPVKMRLARSGLRILTW